MDSDIIILIGQIAKLKLPTGKSIHKIKTFQNKQLQIFNFHHHAFLIVNLKEEFINLINLTS